MPPGAAMLRRERGQMLAVAALIFPVLLGFVGLVVDGGAYYAARRQVQNAADEAALAATHVLEDGGTVSSATAAALEYAAANGFDNDGVSNTVNIDIPPTSGNHQGDPDYVEVLINEEAPTFFIHVLLADAPNVQGRAVAGLTQSDGGGYAIFANNNNCGNPDALEVPGSTNVVNGGMHSNANIKVAGSNNTLNGPTTYRCSIQIGGQNNTFNPAPDQTGNRPLPVNYTFSDFPPCTFTFTHPANLNSVQEVWVGGNQNSNQLLPGVYCSTSTLSLSGSNVSGNVTFAAMGKVNISGSNFNLTPYWNNVLMFTEDASSSALDVSGSGGTWQGILLAPNGKAKVAGSGNFAYSGSIIGDTVQVSGSNFSITALDYGFAGPPVVQLVE
ncbi:MAG: Tad domain-containing protein [Chloroflexi bacterium]|nr:Tad domain-containing protein [Chloroflexota bacterium]